MLPPNTGEKTKKIVTSIKSCWDNKDVDLKTQADVLFLSAPRLRTSNMASWSCIMSSKSPFYHHVWMPWSEYVISTCFLNSHLRLPVLKCNGIITIRCFCAGIPQPVCLLGHFILSGMTRDSYANEAEHRPRTAYGIVLAEPIWPTGFHCEIPNFYIMQSQTVWEKGHADINTSLGTWCCAAWKKKKVIV